MLCDLREFDLEHVHQGIDLIFAPLEILNAEGIDRDDLDTALIAHLEDLGASSAHAGYVSGV